MYHRKLESEILKGIKNNPVTAIIGPRQCGKSTLAKHINTLQEKEVVFLDLERTTDLRKLDNAEWFLSSQKNKFICLDEIQRKPELFPLIRSLTDEWEGNGHFLILGSASRELIQQSSESLAGRITYKQLSPFLFTEIQYDFTLEDYLNRGGFPRSILKTEDDASFDWRQDFITTFLERDLRFWSGFAPETMRKLWQMLAHFNGQIINYQLLANSIGVSAPTIKNYLELLSSTFMIQLLQPYLPNMGKRLIKSPKVYISDTGIANSLSGLRSFEDLAGHPSMGAIWESMVLNNLKSHFPLAEFFFYRTSHGAEIDIVIKYFNKLICLECKTSEHPVLSKGNHSVIHDLHPEITLIVAPVKEGWPVKEKVEVVNLNETIAKIQEIFTQ